MRVVCWLGLAFLWTTVVNAQTRVGVELDEVVDNRMSSRGADEFQLRGGLELRVKLTGAGLDKVVAARVLVTEAKDDKGTALVDRSASVPDFTPREYNSGTLQLSVGQPARAASTVRLKGTIELYVPDRDPNANVKIDGALGKLDAPLSSKALKTAKIEITPLSREAYVALLKSRKLTDKDVEQIRAEGKAHGASDKEIEMAIGLARAMEGMDSDLPENAVVLSGKKADFDRIFRVEILGTDGKPISVGSRGTSTRGESSLMTLQPSDPLPPKATLQLMLLTDKSRVSFPFDLKVPLP